jgi:hypothetical protein
VRIYCNACEGRARIASRDALSVEFAKLYCQCLDVVNCGHTFVMNLTYSHTLRPSAEVIEKQMLSNHREQRELFG